MADVFKTTQSQKTIKCFFDESEALALLQSRDAHFVLCHDAPCGTVGAAAAPTWRLNTFFVRHYDTTESS